MPKQAGIIKNFLGLNTEISSMDAKPGTLIQAQDCEIKNPGQIKIRNKIEQAHSLSLTLSNSYEPGYGLFQFSADYDWSGTPANTPTDY